MCGHVKVDLLEVFMTFANMNNIQVLKKLKKELLVGTNSPMILM